MWVINKSFYHGRHNYDELALQFGFFAIVTAMWMFLVADIFIETVVLQWFVLSACVLAALYLLCLYLFLSVVIRNRKIKGALVVPGSEGPDESDDMSPGPSRGMYAVSTGMKTFPFSNDER